MSTIRDDVALALQLADEADALTMERFGALDLHVDTKPDLTPVTDADRSVDVMNFVMSSASFLCADGRMYIMWPPS